VFYGKQDFWALADDRPSRSGGGRRDEALLHADAAPGEPEEHFVLILPFTAPGARNMVAWCPLAPITPAVEYRRRS